MAFTKELEMERIYSTRRSVLLDRVELVKDVISKIGFDKFFESCVKDINGKAKATMFEERVFIKWKWRCAEEFFNLNYNVDDVIIKSSDFSPYSLMLSREDVRVKEEQEIQEEVLA
jgi:hypothetical protein